MTIKSYIIEYLRNKDYVAGGSIERRLMEFLPTKGGTIERTCRSMVSSGTLKRRDDKGYVEYKLNIL